MSSGSRPSNFSSSPDTKNALKFSYGNLWGISRDQTMFKNCLGGSSEVVGFSGGGGGGGGGGRGGIWIISSPRAIFKGSSVMASSDWGAKGSFLEIERSGF